MFRIRDALVRRVLGRHAEAHHILRAQRLNGHRRDHRRIDAAGKAHHRFLIPAFVQIIPHSHHQGAKHFLFIAFRRGTQIALPLFQVDPHQILFKTFGLRDDLSVGGQGKTVAVEQQVVVTANLVDQHERKMKLFNDVTSQLKAGLPAADAIGRSGNVNNNFGARLHQLFDRIGLIDILIVKAGEVPDILADGDAEFFSEPFKNHRTTPRLKVAGFIVNVIGRQEHFIGLGQNFPTMEKGRGIGQTLADGALAFSDMPQQDGRTLDFGHQTGQGCLTL